MTCVNKILKIRHPGTLHNFSWPNDLQAFERYNLIYGWNGSGKTTISNLFRAIELGKASENYIDARLLINGSSVEGTDFKNKKHLVRVFNRDFVKENVFSIQGEDVSPIFVFGKDSVEKQKQVEKLKDKLTEAESKREKEDKKHQKASGFFEQHCIDRASGIKRILTARGVKYYNNYDRANYKERAKKMISNDNANDYHLTDEKRRILMQNIQSKQKELVDKIAWQIPDLNKLINAASNLLNQRVVADTISELKDDNELSSWVKQGMDVHTSRDADQCLFCEQSLPKDRIKKLEAHFNDKYKQLTHDLDAQIKNIQNHMDSAKAVLSSLPNKALFYDHLVKDYETAYKNLESSLNELNIFLKNIKNALEKKKTQAFDRQTLNTVAPKAPFHFVEATNKIVQQHNDLSNRFDQEVEQARKNLEDEWVANKLDQFKKLKKNVYVCDQNVVQLKTEIEQVKKQIVQVESEITEHRKPAEDVNEDIKNYLGHSELQLTPNKTGYTITRNNRLAEDLSEGEQTAIALLYFLKSLQDRSFDLSKGIVVLDDPVSSLDSNALYLAFGFIRNRVQNAAQVFILTHNFALLNLVKNWFKHENRQKKDSAKLYMLDLKLNTDQRFSVLKSLDPLLKNYESDYHYLFSQVYKAANKSEKSLEQNYVLPNMARRLLEGFLAFRMPGASIDKGLWRKLKEIEFNESKKIRVDRFLNMQSHATPIQSNQHDLSLLAETRSVLKNVLDLMKNEDEKHYKAMEELVSQNGPSS